MSSNYVEATADSQLRRVAVVQTAPVLFDTPKSLQKLAYLTADAANQQAELVVFPEAFVGGYYKGHDFVVSVGIRSPEGRDEFRRLFENAVEVPGQATEFIGNVARDNSVCSQHIPSRVTAHVDVGGSANWQTAVFLIGRSSDVDLPEATDRFSRQKASSIDPQQFAQRCGIPSIRFAFLAFFRLNQDHSVATEVT